MTMTTTAFQKFLLILMSASFGACSFQSTAQVTDAQADVISLQTPNQEKKSPLTMVSTYTMPPSEGKPSYRFAFTAGPRLWSRGSSDAKSNQIMFSDDFGKSWKFTTLPTGDYAPNTIFFVDQEHGWAIDEGDVLRSVDGGVSWSETPLPSAHKMTELNAIEFKDTATGFIAGSTSFIAERGSGTISYGVQILCTKNGGRAWNICYENKENNQVLKIVCLEASTVFLVDGDTLLITNDRGVTWKKKVLTFPATDIAASSVGVIWTTGQDGVLRSSTDLGDSWHSAPKGFENIPTVRWNSLAFSPDGVGVAVGEKGAVAVTTDNGGTWQFNSSVVGGEDLWTVRVMTPYVAVLGGQRLTVLRLQ